MPAVKRNRATELFWGLHRRLFAASGGRLGARALGMPTLRQQRAGDRGIPMVVLDPLD
jgi:hypothetical protein